MGKKSSKTTAKTVYGNTTTTNPYVISQTNNGGTVSSFVKDSAFDTINNFVNNNIGNLLQEYLNPTLNSVTNQAKLNSFMNTLSGETARAMENNIINPLSKRNMVRSSQATDMYNRLAQNNASQVANYANELLAGSQKDTASLLSNLIMLYMNGYNVLNDTQKQSLSTSQGNASKTNTSSGTSMLDTSQMMQLATQMALIAAGL